MKKDTIDIWNFDERFQYLKCDLAKCPHMGAESLCAFDIRDTRYIEPDPACKNTKIVEMCKPKEVY